MAVYESRWRRRGAGVRGQLSSERCFACRRAASSGIVAEYEDIPYGRLCADCLPSLAARYGFLGAVFNAFPHDDRQVRLAVSSPAPLPPAVRRAFEQSLREVARARGLECSAERRDIAG